MSRRKFTKGLVSIVTPVYNGEAYLSGYLESILDQTYNKMELILVDDGSEDRTVAVAEEYREKFENKGIPFYILKEKHRNASSALSCGLPYVSGEYLIWPDSDDVLRKNSVEIRVSYLKEHPQYQCVRSLSYYFDPVTKKRMQADEKRGNPKQEELFWDILEARTFVCCGCYMLRSEAFFDIYPEGKIPVYNVGQNFQMLLPFMYFHRCPTIEQELYGVAVRRGSHSRRVLTQGETEEKYREYEKLVDDIAGICGITDTSSLKRIERWKGWRRLQLAIQYRLFGRSMKAWFTLIKLGERNMLPVLKEMVWMRVKNSRFAGIAHQIHRIWRYIVCFIRNLEWEFYKYRKRKKLNVQPTIIASNCAGTIIYHDMKLPWTSPTINLGMAIEDFIKFVENLPWYLQQEIRPMEDLSCDYPVGMLQDIRVNFTHYETFDEAVKKWQERKRRVDWDHIYIMGCEKDGCTYETLQRFEALPYKKKVVFTKQEYTEFASAFYIRGFEKCQELGNIISFKPGFLKRRYIDDFDYIAFINEGTVHCKKRGK